MIQRDEAVREYKGNRTKTCEAVNVVRSSVRWMTAQRKSFQTLAADSDWVQRRKACRL